MDITNKEKTCEVFGIYLGKIPTYCVPAKIYVSKNLTQRELDCHT